jgi:hypothetical protein
MAKLPNPYRRLPGTGSGMFGTVRLYQAADHLLQVSSSGYTETYRRFYFRDIQGFIVNESVKGRNWNGVWGILGAICISAAIQVGGAEGIVWWGIAGIFLLLLIINIAGGPTCVCQIRTAVQTRPLPSLGRLRRAVKTIAQLRPHIEAAQGALPAEEITRRIDDARRGPASVFTSPISVSADPPSA